MIGERFLFFVFFFIFLFFSLLFFFLSVAVAAALSSSLGREEKGKMKSAYLSFFFFLFLFLFSLFSLFYFLFSFFFFALINQILIQKPMSQQPPRLVRRSPSRLRRCAKFRRLCSCSCWIQAGSFQSVSILSSPHISHISSVSYVEKKKQ